MRKVINLPNEIFNYLRASPFTRDELLIPYVQEAADPFDLTILPGFEVTVPDCGGTHVLVIFSEESSLITIDDVVSQLFPPGNPRFRGSDVLPTTRRIEELNEILKQSELDYLLVFAPFLAQFDLDSILQSAGLPGSQIIPAKSYLLSFLALKLLGTERYAHVGAAYNL